MTREEINVLGLEELEQRRAAIAVETDSADAEVIETLNAELEMIEERTRVLNAEIEQRKAAAEEVIKGAGKQIETRKEDKKMTNLEVRNSKEYIDAFAKYIKTGKDAECRALLTENVTGGTVPVPEFVQSRVEANWERDEVWRRVRKTFVRGNLKVGFEISATGAVVHTEGAAAPAEETLTLGIVTMVPKNIKKWITVSDEVLALGSEEFLAYIYDELTYKIIQKAGDEVLQAIFDAPATSSATAVGIPTSLVVGDIQLSNILIAMAELGSDARDLVFIANSETITDLRIAALEMNYAYDPFQGMTVITRDLPSDETQDRLIAIIGDLSGVQANLPEGDAVSFKFDDLSLAEKDMVKIVGRMYAAINVVRPGMIVKIIASR